MFQQNILNILNYPKASIEVVNTECLHPKYEESGAEIICFHAYFVLDSNVLPIKMRIL